MRVCIRARVCARAHAYFVASLITVTLNFGDYSRNLLYFRVCSQNVKSDSEQAVLTEKFTHGCTCAG